MKHAVAPRLGEKPSQITLAMEPFSGDSRQTKAMLQLQNVVRRFGDRTALAGVSFTVRPGEVVGFVGRNGAGKTTTMRVVMGLLEPNDGCVLWNEEPLDDETRRRIGYMPEERGLYPKMRCIDQLAYFSKLAGVAPSQAKQHAADLLDSFGLADRASDTVEKLSLGNQQRVQLAAALVGDPTVLMLDEPFSGLDPVGVDALSALLRQRTLAGVGMLFSSHQLELLEQLADRVVIIDQGLILADERVDPTNPGALGIRYRALINSENVATGNSPARGAVNAIAENNGSAEGPRNTESIGNHSGNSGNSGSTGSECAVSTSSNGESVTSASSQLPHEQIQ